MGHESSPTESPSGTTAWRDFVADWSADRVAFRVSWGKAMMWVFLVSDTFVFSCFLVAYMTVRTSTPVAWPNASEVFALTIGGVELPLILIAIMTFVLISSSGTMAMAVRAAALGRRREAGLLVLLTAALGASFVGMQAFEWSKLIVEEGIRPWGNPLGAPQFGAAFFTITGFHGLHVSAGVVYLLVVAIRLLTRGGTAADRGQGVEIAGLYWHFVDLVWVFIFAFFYLW